MVTTSCGFVFPVLCSLFQHGHHTPAGNTLSTVNFRAIYYVKLWWVRFSLYKVRAYPAVFLVWLCPSWCVLDIRIWWHLSLYRGPSHTILCYRLSHHTMICCLSYRMLPILSYALVYHNRTACVMVYTPVPLSCAGCGLYQRTLTLREYLASARAIKGTAGRQ